MTVVLIGFCRLAGRPNLKNDNPVRGLRWVAAQGVAGPGFACLATSCAAAYCALLCTTIPILSLDGFPAGNKNPTYSKSIDRRIPRSPATPCGQGSRLPSGHCRREPNRSQRFIPKPILSCDSSTQTRLAPTIASKASRNRYASRSRTKPRRLHRAKRPRDSQDQCGRSRWGASDGRS